ncbi:DNA repair protein RecN [Capnocytophaga canimorsus]|uniref:DNA repair protein RecN n=1 Tax=Capnocytophaga canimorsus TaxID=28188 RepID=UPI000BB168E9|nr:DNA repair protein RecN [Capnocytophaga canimorsus]ATA76290.1 DNA repair protein RecN [Capnocytophaga canimorsus]PJI77208.1 DNA repair protein RecN (Recombination protein N) [Capnocytophaga canimorsus]STA71416.1 Recombination protein N [Capnocytophaga canimorsus]
MLTSLSIKNYALIDDLQIDFPEGFIIITGETGAGKSILLDALSLVLGKRADLSALRNTDEKCIIEAEFALEKYDFESVFTELDIDYAPDTFLRREILPSGKSRAFINDTPVTLDVLQQLGQLLVDIHSQHQTLALGSLEYQFQIIDAIANNQHLKSVYAQQLKALKQSEKKLSELIEFQKNANKEYDYNLHLLKELKSAPLQAGIQSELEEIYEQAANVEEIKERISEALQRLSDENIGVISQLRELKGIFGRLENYSQQYKQWFERTESVLIEMEDLQSEVFDVEENIETDPEVLAETSRKLQLIYDLQKKHQVSTVEELMLIQDKLETLVSQVENSADSITQQEQQVALQRTQTLATASQIHQLRQDVLPELDARLTSFMSELGMPNARFSITLTPTESFYANGTDELSFLFSANKGGSFGQLKKVASGGELSRIMLAVKAILAAHTALPTIMFDEIDTGVSGEISQKMGAIMKQMSGNRQVFAITHLPQVAAKGSTHFKVFKEDIDGKTTTQLKRLTQEERIDEISQMLGGKDSANSARNHAIELIRKG